MKRTLLLLACWLALVPTFAAETRGLAQVPVQQRLPMTAPATWTTSLPTDRDTDITSDAQPNAVGGSQWYAPAPPVRQPMQEFDYWRLLRPRGAFFAEWEPKSDWLTLSSYDLKLQMPTYPFFGPPPPFITAGFSYTALDAPASFDLPADLYDIALGASWIRPINQRWTLRLLLSGAFASDFENTSRDAWQIRGGVFALYRPNDRWNFALGALATGRSDLPVIPAAGAIWDPKPGLRVDLMLPRPRVSLLVLDLGTRQHWIYFGGGFTGGTWAYQRMDGDDELLTYREWRLVVGWEVMPPREPGKFFQAGTKFSAEVGTALGRKFEFESDRPSLKPGDAVLLRAGFQY